MTRRTISPERIRRFSNRIAARFKPERVILFGSYARGRPTPDSDVDILVVLPRVGRAARKSAEILLTTPPDFPVDLIVRSSRTLRRRVAEGDFFLRDILAEGKVLYEAAHA